MQSVPMTVEGAEALREELQRLNTELRARIVKAIASPREHCHLKENAEHDADREEQRFCEGRIAEIEGKLHAAQIIDVKSMPQTGKVIFGTTVTILNVETEEERVYQIVGEDEADIKAGKISVTSTIARGLVGKAEGDGVYIK